MTPSTMSAATTFMSFAVTRGVYAAELRGQRREPAADDVGFVSERIGWLPFAGPSGSQFNTMFMGSHFGQSTIPPAINWAWHRWQRPSREMCCMVPLASFKSQPVLLRSILMNSIC